jgi:ubiquinone/menaquinone biosynthesis C-methylase UbiE
MMLRKTAKGDRLPSDWGFRLMALEFKLRDLFQPRKDILKEVGIKPGFHVLDYGCGPGSYVMITAELVGKAGKVYALDAHPLAIKMVQDMISRKHLTNVETVHSECATNLPDNSLDVVLLYDTLHDLGDSNCILGEIHRTLKPSGLLSLSDHHLNEVEIVARVTEKGLFKLVSRGEKTYSFGKR